MGKRFLVTGYFDTLEEAREYAEDISSRLDKDVSIIDREIDGCGSEIEIIKCKESLMREWGDPCAMTFDSWTELKEYLDAPERSIENTVYFWGCIEDFDRWCTAEELKACANESWLEYVQSVTIWFKEVNDAN